MSRESMDFDVVIVGAGPAGLATAIRLAQRAQAAGRELNICVIEKGAEVGAHILSGAVLETRALDELLPDWSSLGAPINVPVRKEKFLLLGKEKSIQWPNALLIPAQKNHGNYIVSLANICRWLAEQAEAMGVNIFPGFAANEILYEGDRVVGVATGDMGVDKNGQPKANYQPGFELRARYTVFAEGCRGHLGKQLIQKFALDEGRDPQHYGIGIKELWEVPEEVHEEGLVLHTAGWPLDNHTYGGSFMYHLDNRQVAVGFVVGLSYQNPYLSPFEEFQRFKTHPAIRRYLEGGRRIAYGARALNEGGWQSLPKLTFPGGMLVGCEAGTLNLPKIKGTHTAMKSGMVAADAMADVLLSDKPEDAPIELTQYEAAFRESWAYEELYRARNVYPAFHKFGTLGGILFTGLDQIVFRGKLPFTLHARTPDHAMLKKASQAKPIDYPKPDNKLTFDRLSSVYLSNTNHEEDQPCHLKLKDPDIPIKVNLPEYDEPAQRYCPAAVYEVVEDDAGSRKFQINFQNCVHCKTCDIKDPSQNIEWTAPEGGGGPVYPNM